MTSDEIDDFLGRTDPASLGVVGTIRPDGSPQLTPVWFQWDGAVVRIWTAEERGWVRNLARDDRVAFSVQEGEPYPAVVIRGRAAIETDDSATVLEIIRDVARRYVAAGEVESYIAAWPGLRTIVTIRPDHITSWSTAG